MSPRTLTLTDPLYAYLLRASVRESELLRELRERTRGLPGAGMQISPEQGQFMSWLVALLGAERAIEVGVFTGYSSLCIAEALTEGGELIACDVNAETTAVAREFWDRAGLQNRISLRLAPATETLQSLLGQGQAGRFDFIFIDADKEAYETYYELAFELLRVGGVMAFDNALWGGAVADPARMDAATQAIRSVIERAAADPGLASSLVPIGDGLLLGTKRR
jgi:caffeoyl-CoA O-methyltransferase